MIKHNKDVIQYTIVNLRKLVHKICHFRQISIYHHRYGPKKYSQHTMLAIFYFIIDLHNHVFLESFFPKTINKKNITTEGIIKFIEESNNIFEVNHNYSKEFKEDTKKEERNREKRRETMNSLDI